MHDKILKINIIVNILHNLCSYTKNLIHFEYFDNNTLTVLKLRQHIVSKIKI